MTVIGTLPTSLLFCSMSLLSSLKEYRQLRSVVDKIPLYCIFGDTVIKSIAHDRPKDMKGLLSIRGLSEDKCRLYGDDILDIVESCKDGQLDKGAKWSDHLPVVLRHGSRGGNRLWTRRKAVFKAFEVGAINTAVNRVAGIPAGREGVYVLELSQGRVYVGHSSDVRKRVQQHIAGQGSAFTKAFPPTGVILPRLGCVTGSPEAAERDETLRYMFLRGIQAVRGWKYVRVQMPPEEEQDAESNIRELFDLCRRCGHPGHFIGHCKANFDRLGRPCAK